MLESLDAAAVRTWGTTALATLDGHRAELDALNVFPIPDRDTGTNLVLTMRAALAGLDGSEHDGVEALRRLAGAAVLGALGNSGGIMAQLFVSLAQAVADAGVFDAAAFADGLRRGAADARAAVKDPVEGTILSVARAAANATPVDRAAAVPLGIVAASVLAAADEALQRTTAQLPELSRAGVVDAGGRGLVLVLESLVRTIAGEFGAELSTPAELPRDHDYQGHRRHESGEFAYEVQYLLNAGPVAAGAVREALGDMGDSVVVVGTGAGVWNVHAHVNDVGAAIEVGVEAGRPHRISVIRFDEQLARSSGRVGSVVIAVAPGKGLSALFESERVRVLSEDEPSAADVLSAIQASGAADVVLLPNSVALRRVAETAADRARAEGIRVSIVPTRSPVQGLAAVAVHDASRRFDDDVVAMAEAAAATRFAEVAVAESESLTSVGVCQGGDLLGLIDGEVVEIGRGLLSVAFALVDRLLAIGPELVTVLVGAGAQPGTGQVIDRHVRERSPLTEVSVYQVDEASLALVIGAE